MKRLTVLFVALFFVVATSDIAGASVYANAYWETDGTGIPHSWNVSCHGPYYPELLLGAPDVSEYGPDGRTAGWAGGVDYGIVEVAFGEIIYGIDRYGYGWEAPISNPGNSTNILNGAGGDLIITGFGPQPNWEVGLLTDTGWTWSGMIGSAYASPPRVLVEWEFDFSDSMFGLAEGEEIFRVAIHSNMAKYIDGLEALHPVPVPGAIWLLGSGLLGLVGLRKKG